MNKRKGRSPGWGSKSHVIEKSNLNDQGSVSPGRRDRLKKC
jgi:hypothetical protein